MIISLPEHVRNKIAAGEVIERPINVIKELVENSIDSGSDRIVIEIEPSSFSRMSVRDNGSGMDEQDLKLCALPHTTSKIRDEKDLESITTLGFRGEALASMAQVSALSVRSRKKGSDSGNEIRFREGKLEGFGKFAMPEGTEVVVENLFSNLPVRKKSLSNSSSELYQIYRLIDSFAILNPGIRFSVLCSGKVVKEYLSCTVEERIAEAWGNSVAGNLVRVEAGGSGYSLSAFFSRPGFTFKSVSHQLVFVNNRLVRLYEIEQHVKKLYKDMLFLDTNPLFVLFFSIPFDELDVNVHPNKKSVKFLKPEKVLELVASAFGNLLADKRGSIGVSSSVIPTGRKGQSNLPSVPKQTKVLEVQTEIKGASDGLQARAFVGNQPEQQSGFRVVGQLNKTYIVVEQRDCLMLIDQHAAEERVFFEQAISSASTRSVSLIMPVTLSLSVAERQWVKDNLKALHALGFEIEEFGSDSFILRALPDYMQYYEGMLGDMIGELGELDSSSSEQILKHRLATFACRRAVKANEELNEIRMKDLVARLLACEKPFTCPHGRPTVIRYSWGDIEKAFKRKA